MASATIVALRACEAQGLHARAAGSRIGAILRSGGDWLATAAAVVMVATLVVQATFLLGQGLLPDGKRFIPAFRTRDGWLVAVACTLFVGAEWRTLADMAGPPMSGVLNGYITPAYSAVLLIAARLYQLRWPAAEGRSAFSELIRR